MLIIQFQPRKPVVDHAESTAPTRQHELDHTDEEYTVSDLPGRCTLDHELQWE